MVIQKIAKFKKDGENSYSVWYDRVLYVNQRVCMSKAEFDLAQCIDEFIRRGIDPQDIERLVELTNNSAAEELSNYM